jgi:hypothetical protein
MNTKQEIWHVGYNGPKAVQFIELFPQPNAKDKAVILFHGVPEVVDAADLYESRAACYRDAGNRKQATALQAMQQATEWFANADKVESEEVKDGERCLGGT